MGWKPNCQRTQSTGRDSNPRHRSTGAVSSPLDHQCFFSGTGGDRTHIRRFKRQDTAANTLVPSSRTQSCGGSCTLGRSIIRLPLSPLSYARASRAGGNRTHTLRIKSPLCCLLHHDPGIGRVYAFQSVSLQHRCAPSFRSPVVVLRIELSTTRLSAVSGPPALDYQVASVGMVGLEPTIPCARNTWACRYPTSRLFPVRTAGFEPADLLVPDQARCQASPRSVADRARSIAVGWEALESSSPALQTGALPSQLPAQTKNPMSL